MSEAGGNLSSGYWYLSVNSAGEAQLTILSITGNKSVESRIPSDEFEALRELLIRERFFELDDDYGEIVPDSSTQTITIVAGDYSNTVRLHFLMNWANHDPLKLHDPARAVRVGMFIRDWFADQDAVDTRKYDQKVLDALKK